jgi:hypothetical protein
MRTGDDGRTPQRVFALLATFGLVVGMIGILEPAAAAVVNSCWAKNVTQGTPSDTNLQAVIAAASPEDTIAVKYVCVGHFTIGKKLVVRGIATTDVPKPVLNGNGTGRPLFVSARVKIINLKLTGGVLAGDGGCPSSCGAGIANSGTLTLKDTVVRGNTATLAGGGGIYNAYTGTLTLNGSSRVSGNDSGENLGGGILNAGGIVILNDTSSLSGNIGGGGGGISTYQGHGKGVTLNDASSVSGNSVIGWGGGIDIESGNVTLNDSSTVTGNTADSDDFGGGWGGGISLRCGSSGVLTGAVDGGNVNDNYLGTATPVEDNIGYEC